MKKVKIYKLLLWILSSSLILLCCDSPSNLFSRPSFNKKDLIGKWARIIRTDGDLTSNIIYVQVSYQDDGIVHIKGDGILFDKKRAAFFTVNETARWTIMNNKLIEDKIDSELSEVSGDPDLVKHVRTIFNQKKTKGKDLHSESEIEDISLDAFKYIGEEADGKKVVVEYYKIKEG